MGMLDSPGLDMALDDPDYVARQQAAAKETVASGTEQPGLTPEAPPAPPDPVQTAQSFVDSAVPGMSNPQPAPAPAPAGPTTLTTTDRSTTTEGMGAADKAAVIQQGEAAAGSRERQAEMVEERAAAQAKTQTDAAMQDARRQVMAFHQAGAEMAQAQQVHDQTVQALESASKFRPERKKMFESDNAFDVIVTVLGAMAGGWVQGRKGGNNVFLDAMNKMIDDDLEDQVRSNSEYLRELRSRLGSHKAALLELKARMKETSAEFFEARDAINAAPQAKAEAALVAERLRGEASELRGRVAKDVAEKKRSTVTRKQQLVMPKGGGGSAAHKAKAANNLRSLNRINSTLKRAHKSGALAAVIGLFDKPMSKLQRATLGLPPEQEEALTALEELQVDNLMRIVREPNNMKTQDMVQGIGTARTDSAIPVMLQRLDQLLEAEYGAYTGAAPQTPANATGVY